MSSEFLSKDVVYVNSYERTSGESHNFQINLTNQIRTPNDYDTAALLAFSCPKSYYLIDDNNNSFVVTEGKVNTTITIPNGNYSFNALDNTLATLLNASCVFDYAVTNSTTTGLFSFTVTGNAGVQPTFTFGASSPHLVIGFDQAAYTFVADVLTSANMVNFQLTNTLELCCDFVENSVLSVIIPIQPDFSIINYNEQNPSFASHRLTRSNLTGAHFYLVDGNTGRNIDLNGLNFNFTFVIYKKNDYYNHMLQDKKIMTYLESLQSKLKEGNENDTSPNLNKHQIYNNYIESPEMPATDTSSDVAK